MTEEKNIEASNQPQDKFADERLTEEQLDNIAGGLNGFAIISLIKYITELTKKNSNKSPGEFWTDPGKIQRHDGTSGK